MGTVNQNQKSDKAADKSQQSGAPVTASSATEVGVKDVVRTLKKYVKAEKTLASIPGMKEAILKVKEEKVKCRAYAHKLLDKELDEAEKGNED